MKRKNNQAQSFLEYAILICVLVAALLAMRIFLVRTVQEKYRQSADVFGEGEQYAKGITVVTNLDGALTDTPTLRPEDTDICPTINRRVSSLESQVEDLRSRASDFDARASEIEAQAQILIDQGLTEQVAPLLESAAELRRRAEGFREEALLKEEQIARYRQDYPDCFSGS